MLIALQRFGLSKRALNIITSLYTNATFFTKNVVGSYTTGVVGSEASTEEWSPRKKLRSGGQANDKEAAGGGADRGETASRTIGSGEGTELERPVELMQMAVSSQGSKTTEGKDDCAGSARGRGRSW